MTDDEDIPDSVSEFFTHDQAIGLIATIDREQGNIKKELQAKVDLSENILKRLIQAAVSVDLLEETRMRPGDHPRSTRYQLTERGKAAQSILRIIGLDEVQREYMARKRELEDVKEDVSDIVAEEGLDEEYLQQDVWVRTKTGDVEIDQEELRNTVAELHQDDSSLRLPDRPEANEHPVDIVDSDEHDADNERTPDEVWGDPEDDVSKSDE